MKKLLVAAAIAAVLPMGSAFADSDIGCGLGSMVLEGKEGKPFKVLGATLNGTSGNQTFGISFGTMGCDGTGTIGTNDKVAMFIDGNMDALARDVARGEGETLGALAATWGIDAADQAAFAELAQAEFGTIFASTEVTSDEVMQNLNAVIAASELSAYALS